MKTFATIILIVILSINTTHIQGSPTEDPIGGETFRHCVKKTSDDLFVFR